MLHKAGGAEAVTQIIPINTIESYGDFFQPHSLEPRTEDDTALIARYKKAITEGRTPPAIVVYDVVGGKRYLADGRHRLCACMELGLSEIRADLFHAATVGDVLRAALQVFGPVAFCRTACEEFLRQEKGNP